MTTNVGIRGGNPYCLSRPAAEALMLRWKLDEWGWLRARILVEALNHDGDFHGEQLEHVQLSERNMIGAVVGAMVSDRLLAQTSQHRASRSPASHGRRSYVYRLTELGRDFAEKHFDALVRLGGRLDPSPQTRLEL